MGIKENLSAVQEQIELACRRSGRDRGQVTVIAVSKTVDIERVAEAAQAGQRDFGENKAQEFKHKVAAFPAYNWHFIGHLQTNKVKDVIGKAQLIHSLDRLSLAEELQKRAEGRLIHCLLEVNVAQEESKFGLLPAEVAAFCRQMEQYPALVLDGLMTVAPAAEDPEQVRPVFRELRSLRDTLQQLQLPWAPMRLLSMGMTADYRIAVEEGADLVRIGTGIFGARNYQKNG